MFDFNPRPLAGATRYSDFRRQCDPISIHAPLRGRPSAHCAMVPNSLFQSTPPCGGDRKRLACWMMIQHFNPRPLAGATCPLPGQGQRRCDFNPRPLAGATSPLLPTSSSRPYFNPRPLAGATKWYLWDGQKYIISIHAPLRGRPQKPAKRRRKRRFQSTPPCGGDADRDASWLLRWISIHAPLRGRRG